VLSALLFGLDLEAARSGISKDLDELIDEGARGWVLLGVAAGLPLASLLALMMKRWLALLPLAISIGLFCVWALYYATDWWSNPGQAAWAPASGLVLLGWVLLIVAVVRRRRGPWMDS